MNWFFQLLLGQPLRTNLTCRKLVVPKLVAAGWNKEPHWITEQKTTSQLLTASDDAPTVKNVAMASVIGFITELKQIIGRGNRVRNDYGKIPSVSSMLLASCDPVGCEQTGGMIS